MGAPRVSIICPVYNVERYLNRCIDSILRQTNGDFELILIDDGSPDNSGKICDEYARNDKRIIVIHQPNGGVSSARNVGLRHAKGEWIAFIDSDDWVDDSFLEPIIGNDNNTEFIHFGWVRENPKTGPVAVSIKEKGVFETKDLFSLSMWSSFCWSFFFKNEIIKKYTLSFNEKLKFSEDRLFIMQYATLAQRMRYLDATPYHYYINSESACRSKRDPNTFYDDLNVIESFISFLREKKIIVPDMVVSFVIQKSISGMKSDLSPYRRTLDKKELVSELSICRGFVRSYYGNSFDPFFDSFINWPYCTLAMTAWLPRIFSFAKSFLMRLGVINS